MELVRIYEGVLTSGARCVTLENDLLSITVLPDKGADIYSIEYKPKNGINVLFRSPGGARRPAVVYHAGMSEEQWMDVYPGGWQYMFPNAGSDCKYKGASMGFHGEASVVPWQYRMVEEQNKVSIQLSARLLRTPFILNKTIALSAGSDTLVVHDKITNYSEITVDYVWGQHIAFGAPFLGGKSRLIVPNDEMVSEAYPQGGDVFYRRLASGTVSGWPLAKSPDASTFDFRRIPPEGQRSVDMAYLTGMKEGWYELLNDELAMGVRVEWDLEAYPYVWLWQEFKGTLDYPFYGCFYVMGVEPASTPFSGGLEEAVQKGYARQIEPNKFQETAIQMRLFQL